MLPTRQVFSSKELEELKNAFSRFISDSNNKVDWSNLNSIKQTIITYKSVVPKELDKIDNESTLLQLEKEVEVVIILEQKLDKEWAEYTERIKSTKERILSKFK